MYSRDSRCWTCRVGAPVGCSFSRPALLPVPARHSQSGWRYLRTVRRHGRYLRRDRPCRGRVSGLSSHDGASLSACDHTSHDPYSIVQPRVGAAHTVALPSLSPPLLGLHPTWTIEGITRNKGRNEKERGKGIQFPPPPKPIPPKSGLLGAAIYLLFYLLPFFPTSARGQVPTP